MKKPTFKILKPGEHLPGIGGISIFRPEFRTLDAPAIIKAAKLKELAEYGYKLFILNRKTATVHIYN